MHATLGPTSNTITTKLTDSLNSITSNISTSVQDTVDEVIANTMDILIDNTMSKLENATIYDNSGTSNVKFEPKVSSGKVPLPPLIEVEVVLSKIVSKRFICE